MLTKEKWEIEYSFIEEKGENSGMYSVAQLCSEMERLKSTLIEQNVAGTTIANNMKIIEAKLTAIDEFLHEEITEDPYEDKGMIIIEAINAIEAKLHAIFLAPNFVHGARLLQAAKEDFSVQSESQPDPDIESEHAIEPQT